MPPKEKKEVSFDRNLFLDRADISVRVSYRRPPDSFRGPISLLRKIAAASITGLQNAAQRKEEFSFDRNLFPDSFTEIDVKNCFSLNRMKALQSQYWIRSSPSSDSCISNVVPSGCWFTNEG
ncbi:hypothetical protein CDAR_456871 [Caerostris darwini]|uniref:Uncharacterized protein n=1 Tax=Caerostris darwini TaxID=1538125 RepID=A0AAV4T2W2_9ARAC|nr:hypothetical protein CDAR_456871 [Caerostris darwini]